MFIKAMNGTYYPLSAVESMWAEKTDKGSKIEWAEVRDVGRVQLFYAEIESALDATSNVIPAYPGFFVMEQCHEEDGTISLTPIPILGWGMSGERGILPITIEGVNHAQQHTVGVLSPDGRVTVALGREFENVDEYSRFVNGNE